MNKVITPPGEVLLCTVDQAASSNRSRGVKHQLHVFFVVFFVVFNYQARSIVMIMNEPSVMDRIRRDYSAEGLEDVFLRLDLLHDYVSAGRLNDVTTLSRSELRGWLEDIIYTARETLREMEHD
jgi:hypothetical protein